MKKSVLLNRLYRAILLALVIVLASEPALVAAKPAEISPRQAQIEALTASGEKFPEHCLFYGTHIGPFMNSYMAMGLDRFCLRIGRNAAFIHALMEARTQWCLAVFGRAVELGAEVIVMGDDSAPHGGPMISPKM